MSDASDLNNSPDDVSKLPAATPLTRAALEIDEYAATLGWDLPARLFALVDSAALRKADPRIAKQLGLSDGDEPGLTPVEQEEIPAGTEHHRLARRGGRLRPVVERLMLPPGAEQSRPRGASDAQLAEWVANHPKREEVRITAAVLRDGRKEIALRLRSKDVAREVLTGPDLVPGLTDALLATFS